MPRLLPLSFVFLFALVLVACQPTEQPPSDAEDEAAGPPPLANNDGPRGLISNRPGASDGYVMFTPIISDTTYLIDRDGQVVHTWKGEFAPSGGVYLLDNGNLLRPIREPDVEAFTGGGQGGRIREYTWDGELVWDFLFSSEEHLLHHDIQPLPNGNVLAIAWEAKSEEEALAAGRRPELVDEKGLWPDMILEFEPIRPDSARIVWEWHAWDHLVQDFDPNLANYGSVAEFPGRIDINANHEAPETTQEELEQLQALGYVPPDADIEDIRPDIFHTNAIHYNAELDQIALSNRVYSEIWIIDHSTTTEEAATSSGGRSGRGGELLYRWGNPAVYGRGTKDDQMSFFQHDVQWIPEGFPGAGNLLFYNNSVPSKEDPDVMNSKVYELEVPLTEAGTYHLESEQSYGPAEPVWSYSSYFSPFVSGTHRLENGNTMVTMGPQGRFLEVTPAGEIVWEYGTPYSGYVTNSDGSFPHPVDDATYAVFRAITIGPDHPAFNGRDLAPLDPQPEILPPPTPPVEEEEEEDAAS